MEVVIGRGDSAKLSKERRVSLDRKPRVLKPAPSVVDMLLELRGLKTQSANFFMKERGLCGSGLNPKLASDMSCVTPEKIEEIWGKCVAYKTTNTTLKPETRKELLQLYFKIYGKMEVTNKEFMTWVVKGYIAEKMGFEVDWASAAASTAVVQASRLEGELLKRDLDEEEAKELLRIAPGVLKPSGSYSKFPDRGVAPSEKKLKSFFSKSSAFSVPQISAMEVAAAEEVFRVEEELLANTRSKQQLLQSSQKIIADKIIAFKFGMDDRLVDKQEAADNIDIVQADLDKILQQIEEAEKIIQGFKDNHDEGNGLFFLGLKRLEELRSERDVLSRKAEFAKFSFEDAERKAKRAQELYEDAGHNMLRSDESMKMVCREIVEVQRLRDAISDHIMLMKSGGGILCWPKPTLHPDIPEDEGGSFHLEPCSFCNRWYNSFDVVMTSCKHFYHPFCITKLVDTQSNCVTCEMPFHPAWRKSFGFRELQADLEDNGGKTALAKSMEELSETFKDSFGAPIREWSRSRGRQSDWDSCGSIHQVLIPCTSGSKLKDLGVYNGSPELQVPAAEEAEEVESPPKKLPPHSVPANLDGCDVLPVEACLDNNTPQHSVDLEVERVAPGLQSEDVVPHGAEPGRYSSSLKRALNPAVQETGTRKKVSLTSLSNGGKEVAVGAKSSVQTPKKPAARRPSSKKGQLEHAADVVAETGGRVITRSKVKNT